MSDWTIHGGRLASAAAAFPQAPRPWLDLSTGINPQGWPGVDALAIEWRALPEEAALAGLEAAAARHFGVAEAARVCALPGTEAGLRALRHLGLPGPFRHVWPGYGTHAEALASSQPIAHADLAAAVRAGGTTLLANPANPDGRLTSAQGLRDLASAAQAAGGWLVVDEAFLDAHEAPSIAALLPADAPVIALRSFGKFFGLAGVRLGFAIGPAALIGRWRAMQGSWPVSAAALAIGTAAYADTGWISAMRATLAQQAAACDAVLRRHGLEPMGASPLFRLVACPGAAAALFEHLAHRGILTRPFTYAPRWLRLGVPASTADLARLDEALATAGELLRHG